MLGVRFLGPLGALPVRARDRRVERRYRRRRSATGGRQVERGHLHRQSDHRRTQPDRDQFGLRLGRRLGLRRGRCRLRRHRQVDRRIRRPGCRRQVRAVRPDRDLGVRARPGARAVAQPTDAERRRTREVGRTRDRDRVAARRTAGYRVGRRRRQLLDPSGPADHRAARRRGSVERRHSRRDRGR